MKKFRISVLLVVVLTMTITNLIAQAKGTVHMIIFADTNDEKIGESCDIDYGKFMNFARDISESTGMGLEKYYYKGNRFTKSNLENVADNITCTENDIIYFYYTGHGYRYKDMDDLLRYMPYLAISNDEYDNKGVDLEWVNTQLYNKNPRLLITFADCCNSMINDYEDPHLDIQSPKIRAAYKKLFVKANGNIIATGSQPGARTKDYEGFSFGNSRVGGFFTYNFLKVIKDITSETYEGEVSWENLLRKTKMETKKFSKNRQIPQYNCKVKVVDKDVSQGIRY